VVSFTPLPLNPQEKSRWYQLDRKLGGPQSQSERGGEEKNSQPLPGLESPIIQPVAIKISFGEFVFFYWSANSRLLSWILVTLNFFWDTLFFYAFNVFTHLTSLFCINSVGSIIYL
jgi:hypothetical protein